MKLQSREYKLMLHPDKFAGDADERQTAVGGFWNEVRERMVHAGVETSGGLDVMDSAKQRCVLFLDTQDKALYRNCDLVLRLRRPLKSEGRWDATLKFRHGDRLLAEACGVRSRKGDKERKFEEDVKMVPRKGQPGFWALFSHSVEARYKKNVTPGAVAQCLEPFSGLREDRLPSPELAVVRVGGADITEHVLEGGALHLPGGTEAQCALILWWREGRPTEPYAAEFSFRFDLNKGRVKEECARSAWTALTSLCHSSWADPRGPTKTALIYGTG
jgi:hypothetical protein